MKIVMSSGHGKYVRGASGYIDEVDEARKVVNKVAEELRFLGIGITTYHDDVSHSQNENLNRIVDFHNSKTRDLDVSVHFNAFETTSKAMGTECLYVTQNELAVKVSGAIAGCGFTNRGSKYRSDLFFLNNTSEPAILIEVCFVDSSTDVNIYKAKFEQICKVIAESVSGASYPEEPEEPEEVPEAMLFQTNHSKIVCTVFGGTSDPNDSAYDGHRITDTELGCALPYKWRDRAPPRIQVLNTDSGKSVLVEVVDVGPWNTDDEDYVLGTARPQAETGTDTTGRTTNKAGIDLTPGAAKAIGLSGKGTVHWAFVKMPPGEGEV